jgi:hypothetical protein
MYGHLKDQEYYHVGRVIFYNERIQNLVRQVMYVNHITEIHKQAIEKDVFAKELLVKFRTWMKSKTPDQSHGGVDYLLQRIEESNKFRNSVAHSMPFLKMYRLEDKEYLPYLNLLKARSSEDDEFEFSNIIVSFENLHLYYSECQMIYNILLSIFSSKVTPFEDNKFVPEKSTIIFHPEYLKDLKKTEFNFNKVSLTNV